METKKTIEDLARGQDGVVAWWQAAALCVPRGVFRAAVSGWRQVHHGVYVSGHGRITDHQRLMIACLTTPQTAVSHETAGWLYGLRKRENGPVNVVRPGSGGPEKVSALPFEQADHEHLDLLVRRSSVLVPADLTVRDGIKATTPERTVLDLVGASRYPDAQDRLVRDALRTEVVSRQGLHDVVKRNSGRRGCGRLRGLNERYALLPIDRARSDAEVRALTVLAEAGVPTPQLNVFVVGHEGDLVWVAERFILELDSRQYHPFPSVDEAKQRVWEAAGWGVQHLPVSVAEDSPRLLIETALRGISADAVAARVRRYSP